jgi:hypothetical protein
MRGRVTALHCSTYRMLTIGSTDEKLIDGHAVLYYILFIIVMMNIPLPSRPRTTGERKGKRAGGMAGDEERKERKG